MALARVVAAETGLTAAQVRAVQERTRAAILRHVLAGGRACLQGFGTYELVGTRGRAYRHPLTGERVDVPPRAKVRFRPCEYVRARAAALRDARDRHIDDPVPRETGRDAEEHTYEQSHPAGAPRRRPGDALVC